MLPGPSKIRSRLSQFLAARFPEWPNVQASGLADRTTGWETEVYSFVAQYQAGSESRREDLVLRLYPGRGAVEKAGREFCFLQAMYRVGYPVPRPVALEADGSTFGWPFLIMERIEGRPLSEAMDRAKEPERERLLALFCRLMVNLHALDWQALAADPTQYTPDVACERYVTQLQQDVERLGQRQFLPVVGWLRNACRRVRWEHLAVIHGDLHLANVLLRQDGSAVVIDWAGAEISDYRTDLAWTLLLLSTYNEAREGERFLSLYEQMAGHRVTDMECFEVGAILRRLIAAAAIAGGQAVALGLRPDARSEMELDTENVRRVYALLLDRTGIAIPEVEAIVADGVA